MEETSAKAGPGVRFTPGTPLSDVHADHHNEMDAEILRVRSDLGSEERLRELGDLELADKIRFLTTLVTGLAVGVGALALGIIVDTFV